MNKAQISKVYLLSVPLENDYKHTLYFTSKSEQQSYFASKKIKEYTNFTYMRKDNLIHVPSNYDFIYNANYVMYQNPRYENKWFYAFIKDMKYENDECTIVEIETDVIQTWFFDYQIKTSFVEREHVSDDTIGKHTIPEGLETGELTLNSIQSYEELKDSCVVVAMTIDPGTKENVWGEFNGNKYDGVGYFIFKTLLETEYSAGGQVTTIHYLLEDLADAGKLDSVVSMFMAPRKMVGWTGDGEWSTMGTSGCYREVTENIPAYEPYSFENFTITKPTKIGNYTPKNRKVLTYPYNYLYLTNNNGADVIYHYEDFSNNPSFKVLGMISPSCSIRAIPLNYKNQSENYNEGINAGKYPVCAWTNDIYTNWLTQNGINIGLSVGSSALSMIGGIALMGTGGGALTGASAIVSGAMGVANALGQVYQQSLLPPQTEGNINSADIGFSYKKNTFEAHKVQIRQEYAEVIDKYFDMYGYKVNMVKVPNKAHRSRYWFTKTIDINIDGSLPQNDLQKIKNAYNNGITFWRNASEIQNYNLSNDIV